MVSPCITCRGKSPLPEPAGKHEPLRGHLTRTVASGLQYQDTSRPVVYLPRGIPEGEGTLRPILRVLDIGLGEPDCLGLGYGARLIQLAIEWCFAAPEVTAILIDLLVDTERAIRCSQLLGFRFVECQTLTAPYAT